jgi:hypothetical protein
VQAMSLTTHLDFIHEHPGVLAIVVRHAGQVQARGDDRLVAIATEFLGLLSKVEPDEARGFLGKESLVGARVNDEEIVVVHLTGHPICKSLSRVLRQSAGRIRPPKRKTPTTVTDVDAADDMPAGSTRPW